MSEKKRVVIAPASYKGTMEPRVAADAIAEAFPGWAQTLIPLADGGEGSLNALMSRFNCRSEHAPCVDPLGRSIRAEYGLNADGVAVIESARCLGLGLVDPSERNVMAASSFGLGLMIKDAVSKGAQEIWIGLGGSAVVDGGIGMIRALGYQILNDKGATIHCPEDGLPTRIAKGDFKITAKLHVLTDVNNPLLGPEGAAMYMAQKGASKEQMTALHEFLHTSARAMEANCGRRLRDKEGAGAAGGLGMAFDFLGAQVLRGGPFFADVALLDEALEEADLLVTGEGAVDMQTPRGKPVSIAIDRALSARVPVVVLCGSWRDYQPPRNVSIFTLQPWDGESPAEALTRLARQVATLL
ncbi:MAG: glycerate kinase [Acidobacteria bacterium]|nr:glycerate kinase [Acidobacteriota bacterium]